MHDTEECPACDGRGVEPCGPECCGTCYRCAGQGELCTECGHPHLPPDDTCWCEPAAEEKT